MPSIFPFLPLSATSTQAPRPVPLFNPHTITSLENSPRTFSPHPRPAHKRNGALQRSAGPDFGQEHNNLVFYLTRCKDTPLQTPEQYPFKGIFPTKIPKIPNLLPSPVGGRHTTPAKMGEKTPPKTTNPTSTPTKSKSLTQNLDLRTKNRNFVRISRGRARLRVYINKKEWKN